MSKMTTDEYGSQVWRNKEGQYHRINGPAYIGVDGTQEWFINDLCHRENGPAIIGANGTQEWFINGLCHRVDGPAYIHPNGSQAWYIDGKYHRIDGPAFIYSDGTRAWWINGNYITNEVIAWIKENDFPDYMKWTDVQKMMFLLAFSGNKS